MRTNVISPNGKNFGLFQISSDYWCGGSDPKYNICGVECDKFLDTDLSDDVSCARKIYDWHGMQAWPVYEKFCSSSKTSNLENTFLKNCNKNEPTGLGPFIQGLETNLAALGPKGAIQEAQGKRFEKCELAEIISNHNNKEFTKAESITLLCLAENESALLASQFRNKDYGLYQINGDWWCRESYDKIESKLFETTTGTSGPSGGRSDTNKMTSLNLCNIDCENLLDDDISDDLSCVSTILKLAGFQSWNAYKSPNNKCHDLDESYVEECGLTFR